MPYSMLLPSQLISQEPFRVRSSNPRTRCIVGNYQSLCKKYDICLIDLFCLFCFHFPQKICEEQWPSTIFVLTPYGTVPSWSRLIMRCTCTRLIVCFERDFSRVVNWGPFLYIWNPCISLIEVPDVLSFTTWRSVLCLISLF